MTARKKPGPGKQPKVEQLELNKETIQDLTESEADAAVGGDKPASGLPVCASYQQACPESGRPRSCYLTCHRGCTGHCPIAEPPIAAKRARKP
jgi:hypothetical protein